MRANALLPHSSPAAATVAANDEPQPPPTLDARNTQPVEEKCNQEPAAAVAVAAEIVNPLVLLQQLERCAAGGPTTRVTTPSPPQSEPSPTDAVPTPPTDDGCDTDSAQQSPTCSPTPGEDALRSNKHVTTGRPDEDFLSSCELTGLASTLSFLRAEIAQLQEVAALPVAPHQAQP